MENFLALYTVSAEGCHSPFFKLGVKVDNQSYFHGQFSLFGLIVLFYNHVQKAKLWIFESIKHTPK